MPPSQISFSVSYKACPQVKEFPKSLSHKENLRTHIGNFDARKVMPPSQLAAPPLKPSAPIATLTSRQPLQAGIGENHLPIATITFSGKTCQQSQAGTGEINYQLCSRHLYWPIWPCTHRHHQLWKPCHPSQVDNGKEIIYKLPPIEC